MNATLITDIQGPELNDLERDWLTSPYLGGIILFTRHFKSYVQLQQLVAEITSINPNLLLTVDHEGGRVQRFRDGFTRVPAMGKLGLLFKLDPALALQAAKASAQVLALELLNVGIHLTYAPVLDVDYGRNQVIGDRGFSTEIDAINQLSYAFMQGLKSVDFTVVAKHFPGHGWVNLDSHVACPVDERSLACIMDADLSVFKQQLPSIDWMMPAHVVYEQVDTEPAGFSRIWLQDILRKQLGFSGRIVSDDLSMAGAAVKGDYAQRAQAALQAGCDVLLACNSSVASHQILQAMADLSVKPLSLAQYQPAPLDTPLSENLVYLNAQKILLEVDLL